MSIQIRIHRSGIDTVMECLTPLTSAQQATDIISLCIENQTNCVLISPQSLPDAFFELRTGFAGEFMQKLQDYQLHSAVVIPMDRLYSERFNQYVLEARQAKFSRIFTDRDEALHWLLPGLDLRY